MRPKVMPKNPVLRDCTVPRLLVSEAWKIRVLGKSRLASWTDIRFARFEVDPSFLHQHHDFKNHRKVYQALAIPLNSTCQNTLQTISIEHTCRIQQCSPQSSPRRWRSSTASAAGMIKTPRSSSQRNSRYSPPRARRCSRASERTSALTSSTTR